MNACPVGGQEELMRHLLAHGCVTEHDVPMNPRLNGKPGVGKTTFLSRQTDGARRVHHAGHPRHAPGRSPDHAGDRGEGRLRYVASALVSAMILGGIVILDEGNRMSERAGPASRRCSTTADMWRASSPASRSRRTRIFPPGETMNDDSSTFELPEYIHSRLQPQILIDFPEKMRSTRPQGKPAFAEDRILEYVTDFLQQAHRGG